MIKINKNSVIAIGIDPGPIKSGWAIYDLDNEVVIASGHDDWKTIREMIIQYATDGFYHLLAVCMEQIIMHGGVPPSKNILQTSQHTGRIKQICATQSLIYNELPRIDICELVSGIRPKRGTKVTKTDMQEAAQELLKAPKILRPQHANDALCAILAHYPPGYMIKKH